MRALKLLDELPSKFRRFGRRLTVGIPQRPIAITEHLEPGRTQVFAEQFVAFPAPAVAAECGGLLVLELQPLDLFEQRGDGGQNAPVDRGGSDQNRFRLENLGNDVVLVASGAVVSLESSPTAS